MTNSQDIDSFTDSAWWLSGHSRTGTDHSYQRPDHHGRLFNNAGKLPNNTPSLASSTSKMVRFITDFLWLHVAFRVASATHVTVWNSTLADAYDEHQSPAVMRSALQVAQHAWKDSELQVSERAMSRQRRSWGALLSRFFKFLHTAITRGARGVSTAQFVTVAACGGGVGSVIMYSDDKHKSGEPWGVPGYLITGATSMTCLAVGGFVYLAGTAGK